MHKIIFRLFVILFVCGFSSCTDDENVGRFESAIVDNPDNLNKFEQLTFLLSIEHEEYGFVNVDSIDSLALFVDTSFWGTFNSENNEAVDSDNVIIDNISYSQEKVSYEFKAPLSISQDNLETAGDFSDFLNDRLDLAPGSYIAEINNLRIPKSDGTFITVTPLLYKDFTIVENTSSAFLGDITIRVNF